MEWGVDCGAFLFYNELEVCFGNGDIIVNSELNSCFNNICENIDVRQNVSKIRVLIKQEACFDEFVKCILGREDILIKLLMSDDAKTRKNVALLIGDIAGAYLGDGMADTFMSELYKAYKDEMQLFVKASYLQALSNFDYRYYVDSLKSELERLTTFSCDVADKKHIDEQIRVISDMIVSIEGVRKHEFTGFDVLSNVVLTTNRRYVDTVKEQLLELDGVDEKCVKTFSAGVMMATDRIAEIMTIRTFDELLFRVAGITVLNSDVNKAAEQVANSALLKFLNKRHNNKDNRPYYFRVELKSKMDMKAKSNFVKKFSSQLEGFTNRQLINSKSDYEFELRLIENKEGSFNCMIKLYTIKDERFAYRTESTSTCLKPVNAAFIVELAKAYMKSDAQVLDPFCGSATLLIERNKKILANTSYGVDISGDNIVKAKINTENAGQIIHFINKDFFEFTHTYLFDEIITDMPFETSNKSKGDIKQIYKQFFANARNYLKGDGRIIMYTHNREFVKEFANVSGFYVLEHKIILEKAGTDLFILQVR